MNKFKKLFEDQVDRVSPLFHRFHDEPVYRSYPMGIDLRDFNIILQVVLTPNHSNIIPKSKNLNIILVTDSKYIYEFYCGIEIKEYTIFKLKSITISTYIPVINDIDIISEENYETKSFYETFKNILQIHPVMYNIEIDSNDDENQEDNSPIKKKFKCDINEGGDTSDIQVSNEFEELLLNEFKEYNIYNKFKFGIHDKSGSRLNSIAEFNISNYLVKGFKQLLNSTSNTTDFNINLKLSTSLILPHSTNNNNNNNNHQQSTEQLSFIYLLSHLNQISEFNKKISDYKIKNKTINNNFTNKIIIVKEINIRYVYILSLTLLGLENYQLVEKIDKFFKLISSIKEKEINTNNNNNNSLINLINITLNHSLLAIYNNISSEQSLKLKLNLIDLSKVSGIPITFEETSLKEIYQSDYGIEDEYYEDSDDDSEDGEFNGIYYSHFEQFNKIKKQQLNEDTNTGGNEIIKVYNQVVSLNIQNINLFEWNCDNQVFNLIAPSLSNSGEDLFYILKRHEKLDQSKHEIIEPTKQVPGYIKINFNEHLGRLYNKLDDQDDIDSDDNENEIQETYIPIPPKESDKSIESNEVNSGCSINPTLSLFKKCFSIYTHGIFDSNFNWSNNYGNNVDEDDCTIQVVVSGTTVAACIDNLPFEIRKEYVWLLQVARLFYKSRLPKFLIPILMKHVEELSKFKELLYSRYHSPLSEYYNDHNIELSLIAKMKNDVGDEDKHDLKSQQFIENRISDILNQLSKNLNCVGKDYTYIRTNDSIIIYYQQPYHSVVIKLQVYHSIQHLITLQSINGNLDCLNAVYDGLNVYMSKSTIYSFNSRYNLIPSFNYNKEDGVDEVYTYIGFKSIKWDYNPNNIPCNYYFCHPFTWLYNYAPKRAYSSDPINGYFINCKQSNKNKSCKDNNNDDHSYGFYLSTEKRNKLVDLKKFRPLPNWNQSLKLLKRLNGYHLIKYSSNINEIIMDNCLILHNELSIQQYGYSIKTNCLLCNDGIVHFNGNYSYWCETCLKQEKHYHKDFKSKHAVIILNGYFNIEFNNEGVYDEDEDIEYNTDYNRQVSIFNDYEHYGFRISLELLQLGFNVTIVTVDGKQKEIDQIYNQLSNSYEFSTGDINRLEIISTENIKFGIDNIEMLSKHVNSNIPKGIDILINSVYSNGITREEDWQTFNNGIISKQLFSRLSEGMGDINLFNSDSEEQYPCDEYIEERIEFTDYSISYDINSSGNNNENDDDGSHSLKVYTDIDKFKEYKVFNYRYCDINNTNNIIDDNNQQFEITREGSIIFIKNNSIPLIDSAISTVNQILKYFISSKN